MVIGGRRTVSTVTLSVIAIGALLLTGLGQTNDEKRPELHPTTLLLQPASPVGQGTTVRIVVNLENSGAVTADAFRVEFFLRPHSEEDGDAAQSWTSFAVVERSGLSPEAQEVELSATLDTSNPDLIPSPGVYEIRVLIDSNDQIPELDEGNNDLRTSLLVNASSQGQPDLRPLSLVFEPPSPVGLSDTVAMAATVANVGDRDASPFAVSFAYCRLAEGGQECSGDHQEFDRRTFSGGLPDGASQSIDAQLNIPELGLASGRYRIRIEVDPTSAERATGQIDEQDEANNVLTTGLFVQGPELAPTGLTFSPSIPHVGETIEATASIKNVGTGSATRVPVAFFIDGVQFALPTISLADNESTDITALLRTNELNLSPGSHTVRVVVDPNNQIAERDETNNEIRTAVRFLPSVPKRPELRPKRIVFSPSSPVDMGQASSLAVLGEVLNTGEVAARDFRVAFSYRPAGGVRWIDVPCVTNCAIAELDPGARVEANAELDLSDLQPGRYEVRVVVDPSSDGQSDGRITELDEFNNEMRTSVTLLAARLPDLLIDGNSVRFEPSLEVRHGDSLQMSLDVVNAGEGVAEPFEVEFAARRVEVEAATVFATRDVPSLAPGERRTLNVPLNTGQLPAGPGFYEIRVAVDPDNEIAELDETNNVFTTGTNPQNAQPLLVRGPDLAPGGLFFDDASISSFDPRVTQGEHVGLTLDVSNIGVEASNAFRISYCVQPLNQGSADCETFRTPQDLRGDERIQFPGLGVGTTVQSHTILDTASLQPGTYQIVARVDTEDAVQEENELNNTASQQLTVMAQPDLTVSRVSLDPPSPIELGASLTVFADITNLGSGPTRTPFDVGVGLRPVGATDCPIDVSREIRNLEADQQVTVSASFAPHQLSGGGFEVCVRADTENVIPEGNEANNTRTSRLIVGQFDLALEAITFDPQPPLNVGADELKLFADVRNLGDGPVIDPFDVRFELRRVSPTPEEAFKPIGDVTIDRIDAGSQAAAKIEIPTAELVPGTYELRVTADGADVIPERNEKNNVKVVQFEIGPPRPQTADLTVTQFSVSSESVMAGQKVQVVAEIANIGREDASSFRAVFFWKRVNDPRRVNFANFQINELAAGERRTLTATLDTSVLWQGTFDLIAVVDNTNQVSEADEANNEATRRLIVTAD